MTRHYQVISCDGHLEIPPDPWTRHILDEHRDRAPRLVALRTGGEGWIVEGSPLIHNGQNVAAGRPLKGAADLLAETNASWMPSLLYMIDDSYSIFHDWYGVNLELTPSEYIWRHFSFGIVRDPLALPMRDLLNTDQIMWGSDFPHSVSSYPESRRWLDEIFAGAPGGLRHRILVDNPCRYFGLDPDAELTPTPT